MFETIKCREALKNYNRMDFFVPKILNYASKNMWKYSVFFPSSTFMDYAKIRWKVLSCCFHTLTDKGMLFSTLKQKVFKVARCPKISKYPYAMQSNFDILSPFWLVENYVKLIELFQHLIGDINLLWWIIIKRMYGLANMQC